MSETLSTAEPGGALVSLRADDASAVIDRLDSIANVLTGLGTSGDKGAQGRPDLTRLPLFFRELRCLYRFNGYARRYVDIVPDDATRKGWDVLADDSHVDVMESEDKRLGITGKIADVSRWGRLDGGAALLLVTVDAATKTDAVDALAQPLDLDTLEEVVNVIVLDGTEVQPFTFGGDPRDPNFREPATWHVTPGGRMAAGPMATSVEVHTSRIIYFPGKKNTPSDRFRSNGGLDDSVLESVWDPIRNLTTTDQGAAIIAQELKIDTLKVQGLASLATSDEQLKFYETKLRALSRSQSMLNMRILDSGDEYTSEAANVTGYRDLSEGARTALSAVTGIPQVILFGDSPGGLNADGSSARTIWDRTISAVQTTLYLPRLERLYEVLFSAKQGPTKGKVPESWRVEFAPLDEPSESEEAATRKTIAETDAIYIGTGVIDPEDVTASRFGEKGYQADLQSVEVSEGGLGGGSFAELEDIRRELEAEEAAAAAEAPAEEAEVEEAEAEPAEAAKAVATAEGADVQKTALNGAQIEKAVAIVQLVSTKALPRETGLGMLRVGYNMSDADAATFMGPVGDSFFVADPADAAAPSQPAADPAEAATEEGDVDGEAGDE